MKKKMSAFNGFGSVATVTTSQLSSKPIGLSAILNLSARNRILCRLVTLSLNAISHDTANETKKKFKKFIIQRSDFILSGTISFRSFCFKKVS